MTQWENECKIVINTSNVKRRNGSCSFLFYCFSMSKRSSVTLLTRLSHCLPHQPSSRNEWLRLQKIFSQCRICRHIEFYHQIVGLIVFSFKYWSFAHMVPIAPLISECFSFPCQVVFYRGFSSSTWVTIWKREALGKKCGRYRNKVLVRSIMTAIDNEEDNKHNLVNEAI